MQDDDRVRTAVHEAGHSCVAALVGLQVTGVRLHPSPVLRSDGLWELGNCGTKGCYRAPPSAVVAFSLAGAAVEQIFYPGTQLNEPDRLIADAHWSRTGFGPKADKWPMFVELFSDDLEHAPRFLDCVGRIAKALLETGELDAHKFAGLSRRYVLNDRELSRLVRLRAKQLVNP